ncbi:metallophosphoesterase family protein [Thermogladius sp. 4427co]|uniref:metallophosphoesterase family protein n=1 Tax=Thermogladius sp. 4427co TaxID=3450718 RepID=UPI003F78F11B
MPLLLATGDIHAPVYSDRFLKSLEKIERKPDAILLAGDIVEHNNIPAFKTVYNKLLEKYSGTPIIAVFGNEEYIGYEREYEKTYPLVKWLKDEYYELDLAGARICIIGSRGSLRKPTRWQEKHLPGLREYYSRLPGRILELARQLKDRGCGNLILLTHYGVTFRNLMGEPSSIWDYLADPELEKILVQEGFRLAIHAHAHRGLYEKILVDSIPVFNVSFPARGRPVLIEL